MTSIFLRRFIIVPFLFMGFFGFFTLPLSAQQPATPTPPPANAEPIITPQLSARPPGLQFDAVTRSGGQLRNSQLAQYIATMYRYGVGIVAIAAIIMTVYGGFRYLIGSSMGDIAAGKKIIQDAIAGMLLVLGAYLILQTVNPAVLGFKSIDLKIVTPESLDDGAVDGHPMRDTDTPPDASTVENFIQNAPNPNGQRP